MSYVANERETVIQCDDEKMKWNLYTLQPRVISKLKKAGIEPVRINEDGAHYYEEIDFGRVSFRNESTRTMSDEQRQAAGLRLKKAREKKN
ncbi:hypothetical protein PC41400_14860 [Paenibacillus chitinolyticus]|uniref:Uncharacterized protein n=1 Tax=Paenibacillus chitinolyticus TaxID=79263 RepID=A0A410WWR0_9BACL|nr:hypothetical protein [Paenibacillus chitinolyticus]MCY9592377.1 hypothetical protein [Paenibacillus chitinolyticus]MCY9599838.1 hypothetical protein [Paenibacillus chitinolyticus]QAV18889.1 hypothetical protein PC41400_14860 [Paenibacillus chitinolyticus]